MVLVVEEEEAGEQNRYDNMGR